MSQGPSGRIVVEIEPSRKKALYAALAKEGITFKQWLLKNLETYLEGCAQPPLFSSHRPNEADAAGGGR